VRATLLQKACRDKMFILPKSSFGEHAMKTIYFESRDEDSTMT
jgi:hypothetical protein